jgi:long-chain acyl-CoA synthetase
MEDTELKFPENFESVQGFFQETAAHFAERQFLIFPDESVELSYEEAIGLWEKGAAFLQAQGVDKGGRVLLSLGNGPEFVLAFGAVFLSGGVPVLINPSTALDLQQELAERCGAKHSIGYQPVPGIAWQNQENFSPAALAKVTDSYAPTVSHRADIAYIIFTSGTTGRMKGTQISHENFLVELGSLMRAYRLGPEDTHLCVLPLYHASALFRNFLIPFGLGSRTVITKEFKVQSFWKLIEEYRVAFVQVVPTILSLLLEYTGLPSPEAVRNMKYIGTASAPCPVGLIKKFEEKTGIPIIEGYGLTETTCGATLNPPSIAERRLGSVGKTVDAATITIIDRNGNSLPANQEGEIRISGPLVSVGYLNQEELPIGVLAEGAILTGDIGYMSVEGFIYIVGRQTELIYRGGLKVSPMEVEKQLVSHPDIEFAVAFSIPHELLGEDIIAYVKPRAGARVEEGEIRRFLADKLPRFKVPTRILAQPELLESQTFKVARDVIREHYLVSRGWRKAESAGQPAGKPHKTRAFLVGETVYLRPVTEKDMTCDRYLDNIMTGEYQRYTLAGRFPQSEFAIKDYWRSMKLPDSMMLAVCDIETDEYVGNISLRIDWVARNVEFGRMIFKEFQHCQYSIESMKLIMKYVFEDLKLRRLYGGGGNPSSIPSLLKLGFTLEGRMRQHGFLGGEWRDLFIMGILDDEYFAIKQGKSVKFREIQLCSPEVLEKITRIVAEAFQVDSQTINSESGPNTLDGWDSLGTVLLWCYLEEEFGLQLSSNDMIWITNVGDLAIMIEGKINEHH